MTAFEDFVNLELPKRIVLLTSINTGYTGDPNSAVAAAINNAPQGTFFIDNTNPDYFLYYKQQQSVSASWILVGSNSGGGSSAGLQFTDAKIANYTANVGELVLVDLVTASGNVTITAPSASANQSFGVKIAGSASGKKVIVNMSPNNIDGATTLDVTTDNAFASFQFDGTNWWETPGGGGSGGSSTGLTPTSIKTANYTAVSGDEVLVDLATAGMDITITSPAHSSNARFAVKLTSVTNGYKVVINPTSGTIEGISSTSLFSDHEFVSFVSIGTTWYRENNRSLSKPSLFYLPRLSPIGSYPLNGTDKLTDYSGNGYNLTEFEASGGTSYGYSVGSTAHIFTTSGQYQVNNTAFRTLSEFTLCVLLRPTGGGDQNVVGYGDVLSGGSDTNWTYTLGVSSGTNYRYYAHSGLNVITTFSFNNITTTINEWQFIALRRNVAGTIVTCSNVKANDIISQSSGTLTAPTDGTSASSVFFIGAAPGASGRFNGRIQNVWFKNQEISDDQLVYLARAALGGV